MLCRIPLKSGYNTLNQLSKKSLSSSRFFHCWNLKRFMMASSALFHHCRQIGSPNWTDGRDFMKQYGTSNLRKIPVTKMLSMNKRKSCNLESSARLCTHRGCSSERLNTSVLQDVCTRGSGKTSNYRRFKPSLESHLASQSSQKAHSYLVFSGT